MSTATNHGHGPAGPSEEELARSVATGHELSDTKIRPLLLSAIATAVLMVVSFALVWGIMLVAGNDGIGEAGNTLSDAEVSQLQLPPEPRLEQDPTIDGTRIENEALQLLESYGWVDEGAGVAHIPLDRAMELIVERGIGPIE